MTTHKSRLLIRGPADARVRVIPRDRGDEPPPAIFEGTIGDSGITAVELSPGYYVVLAPSGTFPANVSPGSDLEVQV